MPNGPIANARHEHLRVQIDIVDVRLHQYVLGASRKRRWEADMHLDTAAPDAVQSVVLFLSRA